MIIAPEKGWRVGTLIESKKVAENIKSLRFQLEKWDKHMAGQHYDIRLTAINGYSTERSYSIVSAPEEEGIIEFGVELVEDGEVSPYLWKIESGRKIEMRGPIGGHFVWSTEEPGPLILIGGGAGATPLLSMLRHYINKRDKGDNRDIIFFMSVRKEEFLPYREEIESYTNKFPNIKYLSTITENATLDWQGFRGRIDENMFREIFGKISLNESNCYICGPTGFVDAAARIMQALGLLGGKIRTERFD